MRKLKEATKEVYSEEFHQGTMRDERGKYAGLKVSDARTRIEAELLAHGKAERMYELLNRPILLSMWNRSSSESARGPMVHRLLEMRTGKPRKRMLNLMKIAPEDIRAEFSNIIEWLREKACARKQGLGHKASLGS